MNRSASFVMVLFGVVGLIGLLTDDPAREPFWWFGLTLAALGAALLGRHLQPADSPASLPLVASLSFFVAGTALELPVVATRVGGAVVASADGLHLIGLLLIAMAMFRLAAARSPNGDVEGRIDAALVTIAVGVVMMDVLASSMDDGSPDRLLIIFVPLVQAPLVAAGARLLISGAGRLLGAWLLVGSCVASMVGTVGFLLVGDVTHPRLSLVAWWASVLLVSLAALHPSTSDIGRVPQDAARLSLGRLAIIGCALITMPLLTLQSGGPNAAVPSIAGLVCVGLVLWRVARLLRERERVSQDLARRAGREAALSTLGQLAVTSTRAGNFRSRYLELVSQVLDATCTIEPIGGDPEDDHELRSTLQSDEVELRVRRDASRPAFTPEETRFASTAADLAASAFARWDVEDQLRHRSTHDALTGLPNRQLLCDLLEERLTDDHTDTALLFLDLDGFKEVNDRLGHHAGDELLQFLAQRLRATVRQGDLVARLAGDEFVIVCADTDGPTAETLAARLAEAARSPYGLAAGEATIDASIGIALAMAGDGVDELLHRADVAMYDAKRQGRGRVAVSWGDDAASDHVTVRTDSPHHPA